MNLEFWRSPDKVAVMGGLTKLSTLLIKRDLSYYQGRIVHSAPHDLSLCTTYHDVIKEGFSVLLYSQKRPAAETEVLVDELSDLLREYLDEVRDGVVFITHSRGGIVARGVLKNMSIPCLGFVSIATPHRGTRVATVASYLGGLNGVLRPLLERTKERGVMMKAIGSTVDLLCSKAIRELRPDSPVLLSLDGEELRGCRVLSIGGTDPTFLVFYKWHESCKKYKEMFSIPDIAGRLIPKRLLPEELKQGRGDGLVTAESSEAPLAYRHYNFPLNHAALPFHPDVRGVILRFLGEVV